MAEIGREADPIRLEFGIEAAVPRLAPRVTRQALPLGSHLTEAAGSSTSRSLTCGNVPNAARVVI